MALTERQKWSVCWAAFGVVAATGFVAITTRTSVAADTSSVEGERAAQDSPSGQQVFDRVCGRCHPHGNRDVGPSLLNKNLDQNRMVDQIRHGTGRMRAIPLTKLPESQMPQLLTYLRSLHALR